METSNILSGHQKDKKDHKFFLIGQKYPYKFGKKKLKEEEKKKKKKKKKKKEEEEEEERKGGLKTTPKLMGSKTT
jgi:hypothetical protein